MLCKRTGWRKGTPSLSRWSQRRGPAKSSGVGCLGSMKKIPGRRACKELPVSCRPSTPFWVTRRANHRHLVRICRKSDRIREFIVDSPRPLPYRLVNDIASIRQRIVAYPSFGC